MNADGIRITDLAAPQLTELQQIAIDYMEGQPDPPLSVDAVLAEAAAQTGLNDFGQEDFRERLTIWLQATVEDKGLNKLGKTAVYNDCVRYVANRLKFERFIRQHPEVLDEEIVSPIIIAGLPRSGTTHLVNLIAADSRLSSIPYWEMKEPIPDEREPALDEKGADPRHTRCAEGWEKSDLVLPLMKNMHGMDPDHIHEELELENLDFSSYNLDWLARVPRWRDYYVSHDQTPHYAYMKNVIKAVQWLRKRNTGVNKIRWILKSPQHMEQLLPLHRTFPDATLAINHRDPAQVITSILTMLAYGDRLRRYDVDIDGLKAYWIDRVKRLLTACVRDRDSLPGNQVIDVLFSEFMSDDVAMVARIYEVAGIGMPHSAREDLQRYMQANPRGKYGQIIYDLEGDFGVSSAQLRQEFSFYTDRFPVLS